MTLRSGTQSAIEQERLDGQGPVVAYLMDSGVAGKYVLGSGKKPTEATAFLHVSGAVYLFDNSSANDDRYFYQVTSTAVIA